MWVSWTATSPRLTCPTCGRCLGTAPQPVPRCGSRQLKPPTQRCPRSASGSKIATRADDLSDQIGDLQNIPDERVCIARSGLIILDVSFYISYKTGRK